MAKLSFCRLMTVNKINFDTLFHFDLASRKQWFFASAARRHIHMCLFLSTIYQYIMSLSVLTLNDKRLLPVM